jgi:hypothetical protein
MHKKQSICGAWEDLKEAVQGPAALRPRISGHHHANIKWELFLPFHNFRFTHFPAGIKKFLIELLKPASRGAAGSGASLMLWGIEAGNML